VKTILSTRAAQAAAKYGEHAPMAAVCCNACRTCATTNVLSLGLGAIIAVGVGVGRFARRFVERA